ncbi:1-(5-phosphoribosyl)-5-[(5-phosphoribosylamino)methylideneamino]imidazole-4-carboxamide isomerase [Candidatus Bathyarchaeota archaeon]|nr:MAG: 1-(5-phosphoribosyl)-5-[(5-phosphoribosylamino)methylideneamino]imidazole-4-carboxamide isomerase [Candidatus Bathyarchaeota archaeon]
MEIIPAVDIMKGRVVRLVRGDPKQLRSYSNLGDPVSVAKRWEAEGAKFIHVVDLDAALGTERNLEVIESIVRSVEASVQVGGGIRSLEIARKLLLMGVKRVILGSLAFSDPHLVESLLREFGEKKVIVALDHKDDVVMVKGWKASTKISVDVAAEKFRELGVKIFLVTSIARDGALLGPDIEILSRLCRRGLKVIAAGGVSSIRDILDLKQVGVHGVVIGRALYEGRLSLREALRAVRID